MVTFTEKELILFNKFIEENDCTVLGFLKSLGVNVTYSYIKNSEGYFEGNMLYKNEYIVVKAKSIKREIIFLSFI